MHLPHNSNSSASSSSLWDNSSLLILAGSLLFLLAAALVLILISSLSFFWQGFFALLAIGVAIFGLLQVPSLQQVQQQLSSAIESAQNDGEQLRTHRQVLENYQQLIKDVLPVWQRQTDLAKHQLEQSITELVNRFSDIHERL